MSTLLAAYYCNGSSPTKEDSCCQCFITIDKKFIMPLGKPAKSKIIRYLETKDGQYLENTDFYHLYNYEKFGHKYECDRCQLACQYAKNWTPMRIKKDGLQMYLKDIVGNK